MTHRSLISRLCAGALVLPVTGCAMVAPETPVLRAHALQTPDAGIPRVDAAYQAAAAAIERRAYAEALDQLQIARQTAPNDVRVLNALGVVYDKLGRFDLSRRYYAQAADTSPDSPVVQSNIAYSARLQAGMAAQAPAVRAPVLAARGDAADPGDGVQAPPRARAPQVAAVSPSPGMLFEATFGPALQFAPATPVADPRRASGVRIVNATGQLAWVEPVRLALAGQGWTVPRAETAAPRGRTLILYPSDRARVAQALARTLPGAAELRVCEQVCREVQLVLGTDVRSWPRSATVTSRGRMS